MSRNEGHDILTLFKVLFIYFFWHSDFCLNALFMLFLWKRRQRLLSTADDNEAFTFDGKFSHCRIWEFWFVVNNFKSHLSFFILRYSQLCRFRKFYVLVSFYFCSPTRLFWWKKLFGRDTFACIVVAVLCCSLFKVNSAISTAFNSKCFGVNTRSVSFCPILTHT